MKSDFLNKFKTNFPNIKDKILSSIDILLIYQLFIFILSPSKLMGILLIVLFFLFNISDN